jgi:drug/metabolite transporter (DMT)-like permease
LSGNLAGGLVAAVGAAALYGCAPIAQAVAAARTPAATGLGLGLIVRLARQPIWLLGLGGEIAAFLLEAYAVSAAPATLVAPLMACDMLVFVLLAWPAFGERPSGAGVWGVVAAGCAVGLLAVAFGSDSRLGDPADNAQLIGFLIACVVVAGLATLIGDRAMGSGRRTVAAAAFSTASGVAYGLATMATRQVGRTFSPDHPWHLLATPTPYVLAGCSILGIAMMQRGLQTSPILTFPITSVVSAFLPVVLGATLLGDQVPTSGARAAFVAALALMAVGVALLARDRRSAHRASEGEPRSSGGSAPPAEGDGG